MSKKQLDEYVGSGLCIDKFNSVNGGCFRVNGIEGGGHFVIANPDRHLLYLSRICEATVQDEEVDGCNGEALVMLHIHEKEPDRQYSIDREYEERKDTQ